MATTPIEATDYADEKVPVARLALARLMEHWQHEFRRRQRIKRVGLYVLGVALLLGLPGFFFNLVPDHGIHRAAFDEIGIGTSIAEVLHKLGPEGDFVVHRKLGPFYGKAMPNVTVGDKQRMYDGHRHSWASDRGGIIVILDQNARVSYKEFYPAARRITWWYWPVYGWFEYEPHRDA